ncbi:NAD(P) transhydrogenase subunit alpha [Micromonospora sp. NBC_00898]|uniref:NAD(P) transhydrogenase subunit alpha n=1 Tax=Micromonospora sp. NBC_00898 TaxID=2975981 RepID=UPI00386E24DC|nr:NAD(P) transhydrogenase subunit alpha [Micromonospora sp. NBC_00898]
MTPLLFADITIFVLSLLVGFEVITKVPATLHTPLMSGANAIHGVVLVGVMVLAATTDTLLGYLILLVAAGFAAMNVVGGYIVTDRMLAMFRTHPTGAADMKGKERS